jgi:hypothetical protein
MEPTFVYKVWLFIGGCCCCQPPKPAESRSYSWAVWWIHFAVTSAGRTINNEFDMGHRHLLRHTHVLFRDASISPRAYVLSLRLWFIFLLKSKMKNEKNRDKKADHEGCHTATLVDYFGVSVWLLSWGRKKGGAAWTRSRHHSGVLSLSVNEKRDIFHFFYLLGRGRYIENKTASYIKILGRNQSRI